MAGCIGCQSREVTAACAWPDWYLAGAGDEARGPVGHRHDGDHGIDAGGTGKGAAVGNEQALDRMRLVIRADHRGLRVASHAAGPHLVKAHVTDLARSVAVPVHLPHEGVDTTTLARRIGDVGGLTGEDFPGAGGFQDPRAGFDPLAHVAQILPREAIVHASGTVPYGDPTAAAVSQQDAGERKTW